MSENEHLDFKDGFDGISRFTCYKSTYAIDEWENKHVIREWDIIRVKEDYFDFLTHINELAKEIEELKSDLNHELSVSKSLRDVIREQDKEIKELKSDLKMARMDSAINRMAQRPTRW